LQGKADQFAQQSPAKRKDVLGNILGLETWDIFKSRTGDLRRNLEAQLARNEGRLGEIRAELEEEVPRRKLLEGLEIELSRVVAARTAQAAALESLRQTHASLDKQRLVIESMEVGLSQSQEYLSDLHGRLLDRRATRAESAELLLRSDQISTAYANGERNGTWHDGIK
jgi:exonuclease SbcC